MDLEKYEEAVRDYEKIVKLEKTPGASSVLLPKFWKSFLNS